MTESVQDYVNLQDTIAVERNFEHALSTFGDAGTQEPVRRLLSSFSEKARICKIVNRRRGARAPLASYFRGL